MFHSVSYYDLLQFPRVILAEMQLLQLIIANALMNVNSNLLESGMMNRRRIGVDD